MCSIFSHLWWTATLVSTVPVLQTMSYLSFNLLFYVVIVVSKGLYFGLDISLACQIYSENLWKHYLAEIRGRMTSNGTTSTPSQSPVRSKYSFKNSFDMSILPFDSKPTTTNPMSYIVSMKRNWVRIIKALLVDKSLTSSLNSMQSNKTMSSPSSVMLRRCRSPWPSLI